MQGIDQSHHVGNLQGRGVPWGKFPADILPPGTTEHKDLSCKEGGELSIISRFPEVFKKNLTCFRMLKTLYIWKLFAYKGTVETLG